MNHLTLEHESIQPKTDFLRLAAYGDEDHLRLSYGEFVEIDNLLDEVLKAISDSADTLEVFAAMIGSINRDYNPSAQDLDLLRTAAFTRAEKALDSHERLAELREVLAERSRQESGRQWGETLTQLTGSGE